MNRKSINLTQKQIENRALIVTTVVNAIITGAGIWMYFLTDLQMMFLDGFFSLIGLLSALAAVLISKVSKRSTKHYPHGLYFLECSVQIRAVDYYDGLRRGIVRTDCL